MIDQEAMLTAYMESSDPDAILKQQLEETLRSAAGTNKPQALDHDDWPLKIFLCGYAGAGNVGADVRVHEILRQFRHLWDKNIELRLSAIDRKACAFFADLAEIREMVYLPVFLPEMTSWADISVACEGSLFKSNFADTLSLAMLASLAFANQAGKPAIAYGAEAGVMSADLQKFTKEFCVGSTVFCRNQQSMGIVSETGLDALAGADTAWSFDPEKPAWARQQLRQSGWDGQRPLIAVCPVNPYWWPVSADPEKFAAFSADGSHAGSHYGFLYFHAESEEITRRFNAYIQAIAEAATTWGEKHGAHIVIVGMDRVDRAACMALAGELSTAHSVFTSPEFDPAGIVSVLRQAKLLVSSRFHAIVCSMSAGVPSVGLAYDERVLNVLTDSGQKNLILPIEEGLSATALSDAMEEAWEQRTPIADQLKHFAARQLLAQGAMGRSLSLLVSECYPHLPLTVHSDKAADYLPPLSKELQDLLQQYGSVSEVSTKAAS